AQRCERDSQGDVHWSEAQQRVPGGSAVVVVGEDDQREMPKRPDDATHESRVSERRHLRQRWHEESAPAKLLAGCRQQTLKRANDKEHDDRRLEPAEIDTSE